MAKSGRPKKYFYFGLDAGNASIKIVGDQFEERIPSYTSKKFFHGSLGSFSRGDLGMTVGRNAVHSSKIFDRVVDDNFAKIDLINSLYLGALAHNTNWPKEMHNRIALSSHAYAHSKDQIKNALTQTNEVITLVDREITITTEVLFIVPEGYGAVYNNRSEYINLEFATLDFGSGTTILTHYSKLKPSPPELVHYGVNNLLLLISDEMRGLNGSYPGNIDEIRTAIESKSFKVQDFDIKDIYNSCLADWWNKGLSSIGKKAKRFINNGERVIALGGGAALPGFQKLLKERGFTIISKRPEMANAIGLYQMALDKGRE